MIFTTFSCHSEDSTKMSKKVKEKWLGIAEPSISWKEERAH